MGTTRLLHLWVFVARQAESLRFARVDIGIVTSPSPQRPTTTKSSRLLLNSSCTLIHRRLDFRHVTFVFSGAAAGGAGGSEEKRDGGIADGGPGQREERLFPREVSAWQLQWRLQRKVLRLEDGLSSQVTFEEIEGEVQVRTRAWNLHRETNDRERISPSLGGLGGLFFCLQARK